MNFIRFNHFFIIQIKPAIIVIKVVIQYLTDSLTLNDGDGSDLDTDAMSDAIHAALGSSDND